MARTVETDEPVVREREVIRDESPRHGVAGIIFVILAILIVLLILFGWRPWSGGSTTNVNVPAPSGNSVR